MTTTAEMTAALKDHFVRHLRKVGFKGSFPNFHRDEDHFVYLVNVQFNSVGEKFCINLGFADVERRNVVAHCRDLEPKKLRLSMTGSLIEGNNHLSGRWRVGAQPLGDGKYSDSWFSYAPRQYGEDRSAVAVDLGMLARHCTTLFKKESDTWWAERRAFAAGMATRPIA